MKVYVEYRRADVAQSAEQLFCKQQVIGSSPIVGSADVVKAIVGSADVAQASSASGTMKLALVRTVQIGRLKKWRRGN